MGPWWARLLERFGIMAFLVLYLLGAIPGMLSPIEKIVHIIEVHERETRERSALQIAMNARLLSLQAELVRLQRITCKGVAAYKSREYMACESESIALP